MIVWGSNKARTYSASTLVTQYDIDVVVARKLKIGSKFEAKLPDKMFTDGLAFKEKKVTRKKAGE